MGPILVALANDVLDLVMAGIGKRAVDGCECHVWAPLRSLSLCVTSGMSHRDSFSEFVFLCNIPFGGLFVACCKMPGRRLTSQCALVSSAYKMSYIDTNAEFESPCDSPMLTWGLVCGIRVAMRHSRCRIGGRLRGLS